MSIIHKFVFNNEQVILFQSGCVSIPYKVFITYFKHLVPTVSKECKIIPECNSGYYLLHFNNLPSLDTISHSAVIDTLQKASSSIDDYFYVVQIIITDKIIHELWDINIKSSNDILIDTYLSYTNAKVIYATLEFSSLCIYLYKKGFNSIPKWTNVDSTGENMWNDSDEPPYIRLTYRKESQIFPSWTDLTNYKLFIDYYNSPLSISIEKNEIYRWKTFSDKYPSNILMGYITYFTNRETGGSYKIIPNNKKDTIIYKSPWNPSKWIDDNPNTHNPYIIPNNSNIIFPDAFLTYQSYRYDNKHMYIEMIRRFYTYEGYIHMIFDLDGIYSFQLSPIIKYYIPPNNQTINQLMSFITKTFDTLQHSPIINTHITNDPYFREMSKWTFDTTQLIDQSWYKIIKKFLTRRLRLNSKLIIINYIKFEELTDDQVSIDTVGALLP
jgi:hypothetical protein